MQYAHAQGELRLGGKLATTALLFALIMCMFLSKLHEIQRQKTIEADTRMIRIVDPAFCKDQTWPYIDQRCLKRVYVAESSSNKESVASPNNLVNLPPRNAESNPVSTAAPGTVNLPPEAATMQAPSHPVMSQPIKATPIPLQAARPVGNLAGSPPIETRETTSDSESDVRVDRHVVDDSQHRERRHWGHEAHFIFGFRF